LTEQYWDRPRNARGEMSTLEEGDSGDATGTGVDAEGGVLRGHAAEREHGDSDGVRGFAQAVEAERWAVAGLGSRREYRTVYGEIGAFGFGGAQFVDCVGGDSDEEPRGNDGTQLSGREGSGGEMDAVGSGGERDVGAGVDEEARAVRVGQREKTADERDESPCGEVLFANLDAVDTGGERAGYAGDERVNASGSMTISDVVADHGRTGKALPVRSLFTAA
jgi:hypothetical protein